MMSGVVVTRGARPGQRGRLKLMPAGDGPASNTWRLCLCFG